MRYTSSMTSHDTAPKDFFLVTDTISVDTRGEGHIIDLTGDLQSSLEHHELLEGHILLFVPGSTGGLTTVEYEPGLLRDLPEFFERIAPRDAHYHHEDTWHDGNGHSHVRASLIGPSLMVPVKDGRPTLGTWQQVILIDFDNKPRQRSLIIQLWGRR
jgi:secondary thiamine-phosphate synthase enzyme